MICWMSIVNGEVGVLMFQIAESLCVCSAFSELAELIRSGSVSNVMPDPSFAVQAFEGILSQVHLPDDHQLLDEVGTAIWEFDLIEERVIPSAQLGLGVYEHTSGISLDFSHSLTRSCSFSDG